MTRRFVGVAAIAMLAVRSAPGHRRRNRRRLLVVLLLALLTAPFVRVNPAAAVGDGSPDPSFGVGGAVRLGEPNYGEMATDVVVQSDGKSVVLFQNGVGDFTLLRLTARGVLDASFGSGGIVRTDLGAPYENAIAITLQHDGKILVAGNVTETTFAIVRYLPSGATDPSFDGDGVLVTHLGPAGQTNGVASITAAPGDKVVVTGKIGSGTIFAARFLSNGSPDTSFDGDGLATTDVVAAFPPLVVSVITQPDGKVIVGGLVPLSSLAGTSWDFLLLRYLENGSPDASFDSDGIVTADATPHGDDLLTSIALQPDGRIVAVGSHVASNASGPPSFDFETMRFLDNGSLDPSFAGTGQLLTSLGGRSYANDVAIQADAKIIVAGSRLFEMVDDVVAVARYMPDGSLDTTFDVDGKATFDGARGVLAIALQPDGKIVGVGSVGTAGSDAAVVRLENSVPSFFTIEAPRRIRDTRLESFVPAGGTVAIHTGAPTGVSSALVNITAVGRSLPGYITADKCSMLGPGPQTRSTSNFIPGQAVANLAVVPLDSDGSFCIYTDQAVDLIVDLQGTFAAAGLRLTALPPIRKLDTRAGAKPAAGAILRVSTDAPAGTTAALVNLTATGASTFGYLTADICSLLSPGPQTKSNANYTKGRDVANMSVVPLDSDGSFCVYTEQTVHILVDLQGFYGPTGLGTLVYTPARVLDTRAGAIPASGSITRVSTGSPGSTAALVNLTMTNATTSGYVTADKCSALTPGPQQKSNGNFTPHQDVANASVVPLDPDGSFCIYNEHAVHLLADIQGLL